MFVYLNLNLVKPCCEWQVCILYNMSVQATIVNGKNLYAKSTIVKWKGMDSVGNESKVSSIKRDENNRKRKNSTKCVIWTRVFTFHEKGMISCIFKQHFLCPIPLTFDIIYKQ